MSRTIQSMQDKYWQPSLDMVRRTFTDYENAEEAQVVVSLIEEIRSMKTYIPELDLIMTDENDEVTGYAMFSKFHLGGKYMDELLLLSPVAVKIECQRQHISKELIEYGFERAKEMGVEKIKTIGDAYMAACGVPEPNENHARIMVDFAKGMLKDLEDYNKTAEIQFQIRIGLNCGPVTAGVIGTHKFIYDVWGNTVNVASRMETAATPGGIRITEALKKQLSGPEKQ